MSLLIILKARRKSAWREKDLSRQSLSHVWHVSLYLHLRRYSPGAVWASITNSVDHASDEGTPGSTVLCELTRSFHPVPSPSCVAEDSRSGEGLQVCLDRRCPRLRLAASSSAQRVGRSRSLIRSPAGCIAAWPNQRRFLCTSGAHESVVNPIERTLLSSLKPNFQGVIRNPTLFNSVRRFRTYGNHTSDTRDFPSTLHRFFLLLKYPSYRVYPVRAENRF